MTLLISATGEKRPNIMSLYKESRRPLERRGLDYLFIFPSSSSSSSSSLPTTLIEKWNNPRNTTRISSHLR